MKKEEFKTEIGKLQIAYNKKFTQEENRMWFQEFQNVTVEEFKKAIDQIIKTKSFIPRIADIKTKISETTYRYYADEQYKHLYKNNEWGQFAD